MRLFFLKISAIVCSLLLAKNGFTGTITSADIQLDLEYRRTQGKINPHTGIHVGYQHIAALMEEMKDLAAEYKKTKKRKDFFSLQYNFQSAWEILTQGHGYGGISRTRKVSPEERQIALSAAAFLGSLTVNFDDLKHELATFSKAPQHDAHKKHLEAITQTAQAAHNLAETLRNFTNPTGGARNIRQNPDLKSLQSLGVIITESILSFYDKKDYGFVYVAEQHTDSSDIVYEWYKRHLYLSDGEVKQRLERVMQSLADPMWEDVEAFEIIKKDLNQLNSIKQRFLVKNDIPSTQPKRHTELEKILEQLENITQQVEEILQEHQGLLPSDIEDSLRFLTEVFQVV